MRYRSRIRRWGPVFSQSRAGPRLFFYAPARPAQGLFFYHHHHGDDRPHLHLAQPAEVDGHHGAIHGGDGPLTGARQLGRHREVGHWHFSPAAGPALGPPILVVALQWQTNLCYELAGLVLLLSADHWARPPPRAI